MTTKPETIEQMAMRIAVQMDEDGFNGSLIDYTAEFARRLVAELDKVAQPVAWRYIEQDGKGHRHFSEQPPSSHDPQDLADAEVIVDALFLHAQPQVSEGWIDSAVSALTALTTTKEYKESQDKDSAYAAMRRAAWEQAYEVLSAAPQPTEKG